VSTTPSAKRKTPPAEYAEELAAEMLATTLNVEFDPDRSWDEKSRSTGCRTKLCARRM